jgi:DNA-binding SARP family transcriptional activator
LFDGAGWTGLGAAKPRTLLAILLLRANELMPAGELIDQLWPQRAPTTAANMLHQYVGRLRRALGDTRGRLLVTRAPGYQLVANADDLDSGQFARLAGDGHAALATGRARHAVGPLREALALWRGPALVDVPETRLVAAEAARLEELRLTALEARITAELTCGQHAGLVGELRQMVDAHPFRERLWSLLLLALDRSGRQGEALAAYRELYALLQAELGIQPTAELQRLHRQILTRDPTAQLVVASTSPAVARRAPRGSDRLEDSWPPLRIV